MGSPTFVCVEATAALQELTSSEASGVDYSPSWKPKVHTSPATEAHSHSDNILEFDLLTGIKPQIQKEHLCGCHWFVISTAFNHTENKSKIWQNGQGFTRTPGANKLAGC